MNNKTKIIIVILPLVLSALTGFAQSAYGDAWNALHWSQQAANSSGEASASYASHAFDGGGHNYGSGTSHNYSSGYSYGSTVTPAQPGRRNATNMSNVGLKISSSGYNRGAELARYYAEQRAERARLKAEREQRMVNSYMQTQYEHAQQMEMSWQIYIANNSHAKPFSQETINEFVSNGLPGNVIIDDNGAQNMLPEALLEGAGSEWENREILEERLKNGEALSDEEWDYLIARKKEEVARLEEEKRELEESIGKTLVGLESSKDYNGHENTLNRNEIDQDRPLYVNSANNIETVNLGKDNEYFYDDNALIVPIDPERIKNQERDERWEKIKKEYFSDTERKDSKNKLFENNLVPLDVTESTTVYSAFTAPGIEADDWENINNNLSESVRKVLEKGGVDKEMAEEDAINFIKGEVLDPIKDKAIGVVSAFTGTGRLLNNMVDVQGTITTIAVDNAFGGVKKVTDNTLKAIIQGGDPTSRNTQIYQQEEQKSLYNLGDYFYRHPNGK